MADRPHRGGYAGGEPQGRLIATGLIDHRLHVLVFIIRRRIRLISLRKANNAEMERYEAVRNTPEEEAAINAGIAADPDNPERTDADFARGTWLSDMTPDQLATMVPPEAATAELRRRGPQFVAKEGNGVDPARPRFVANVACTRPGVAGKGERHAAQSGGAVTLTGQLIV